ncbi:sialin-like [Clavelina lepadiformis]|uniref:sialin-like n=1 Tax=Clavelina lepadiformis TaxID=159417 RepID=UPI00404350F8
MPSEDVILKSGNDDKVEVEIVKPPPGVGTWISARYGLGYLAFFGFVNVYALRVNLSVAILSMVNSSYLVPTNHANVSDVCPASSNQANHTGGEFNWDSNQRSLVLGAFFYGYVLTQLPGGYLASRFGGKLLLGGGVLCTSLLTLLTPIAAQTSFAFLIVVRILEGIGEGVTFPAMHAIWGAWAPAMERTRLTALTYAGLHLGTVIAQPISGILCASNVMGGWPSAFYIFGIIGVIWCVIWFLLAQNYPSQCKWISKEELSYIESHVERAKSFKVPWKEIAMSKPLWAISVAHFCNNWGFYTLLTCLPTYLKDVLRFDITQDGFIAALPYLMSWISCNLAGIIADKIRAKAWLTTTLTRKVFNTVAFVFPAGFLLGAGYVGCNRVLAVTFICLATLFSAFSFAGFNPNHIDLSPRFAGILMGITNTWGNIPGFVSPLVVGAFTENNPSQHQWLYVFYIAAAVYVFGAIFYIVFASGVEQEWNRIPSEDEEEERNLLKE